MSLQNFGAFLGNYADYGNDFAHTATIRFEVGYEANEQDVKQPVYIFATLQGCNERGYDRFGNPPDSYSSSCSSSTIGGDNVNEYTLIAIINLIVEQHPSLFLGDNFIVHFQKCAIQKVKLHYLFE